MRDAGESTCPVCRKTWTVTPLEDCVLPRCGCYGFDLSADNPARPCQDCGIKHAWNCPKMPPSSGPGDRLPGMPRVVTVVSRDVRRPGQQPPTP